MSKYRILVEPGKDYNPEFPPPEAIRDGAELDGFIILGYRNEKDGRVACGVIHETSIADVKAILEEDENDVTVSIRAACALMDGEDKAKEIMRSTEVRKHRQRAEEFAMHIAELLAPEDEIQEFPEDEEQRFPEEEGE